MEIFRDTIVGGYEVSNYGRVFRKETTIKANKHGGTRVTPRAEKATCNNGKGYKIVSLWENGKQTMAYVHILVATAFVPNPENKETVNHKDGDKDNNNDWNLEWNTQAENNKHAFDTGLNKGRKGIPVQQLNMEGEWVADFDSAVKASEATGINRTSIAECCKPFRTNQGHSAGGFKWRFKIIEDEKT